MKKRSDWAGALTALCDLIGRICGYTFALAVIALIGALIYSAVRYEDKGTAAHYRAFKETGLSRVGEGVLVGHVLTGGCYGRDMDETTFFDVAYTDRELIWDTIRLTDGWRTAQITSEEYTQLARREFFGPNDYAAPANDVVFDAWFYRDDYLRQYGEHAAFAGEYEGLPEVLGLNGTPDTLNATFAFYDKETGAFFFHQYDT